MKKIGSPLKPFLRWMILGATLFFLAQALKNHWQEVIAIRNIAKYLPGNVWHFYGRVWAARKAGISLEAAILSVVLETLLMAASALFIALVGSNSERWGLQIVSLAVLKVDVREDLAGI